jgi:sigma-54 dependent transcriptional regulator, acetoin dehydrogenase operon transcriptional activator AcoR
VRPVPVDLRLCAATHQDLEARVAAGAFRQDLLARMSGLTIRLLPLVERREDLGLLVAALLERAGARDVTFTPRAARCLFQHAWPLNVRELEKVLETAVGLAGDSRVDLGHFPDPVRPPSARGEGLRLPEDERRRRDELIALLERHGGNVAEVARSLGKGRMQVHRWVRRWGIPLQRFRRAGR